MKTLSIILFCILITFSSSKTFSQNNVHGPSMKVSFGTLEKSSLGVGYNFLKFNDDWTRYAHNYYLEYLPEFRAFGASANIQYTLLFVKAGMEASFRSKNESNNPYFSICPQIGFDLINIDLSFGPEIVTIKTNDKHVGFKMSLKVHPKIFNKGTNRLRFKKT